MFGERLKLLRNEKMLKQSDIAEALGLTRHSISNYELNEREPDYKTLEQLSNYFDVTVDYLLGRSNIRNPYLISSLQSDSKEHSKNEIENILSETQKMLQDGTDLTLEGEPAAPEAIQSIIDGIDLSLEMAKRRNKKKQE